MKNKPANYVLSIPDGKPWVHIKVSGALTVEADKGMIKEAINLAKQHSLSRYLHDVSESPSTYGILEQYRFVHHDLEEYGFESHSKFAIVIDEEDSSRDFIETVLRNAGYNCRQFIDMAEATEWLLK